MKQSINWLFKNIIGFIIGGVIGFFLFVPVIQEQEGFSGKIHDVLFGLMYQLISIFNLPIEIDLLLTWLLGIIAIGLLGAFIQSLLRRKK